MSPANHAADKQQKELAEGLGHLAYFRNQRLALEYAIPKMQEDLRLCNKNVKIWEERIAAMESKITARLEELHKARKGELGGA